jgi:plastocyanin
MTLRLRALFAVAALCCLCACTGANALASTAPTHRGSPSLGAPKRRACSHRAAHRARPLPRCRRRHKPAAGRPLTSSPTPSSLVAPVPGGLTGELPAAPAPAVSAPGAQSVSAPGSDETPEPTEPPPGEPPPAEPPSVPHVQVSAAEYSFSLSRPSVPAGKVVLEFVNDGQDEHNLNVAEPEGGSLVAAFANTPSKGIGDVEVEMRPGDYTLFCSLPHHESLGMKATLIVE